MGGQKRKPARELIGRVRPAEWSLTSLWALGGGSQGDDSSAPVFRSFLIRPLDGNSVRYVQSFEHPVSICLDHAGVPVVATRVLDEPSSALNGIVNSPDRLGFAGWVL